MSITVYILGTPAAPTTTPTKPTYARPPLIKAIREAFLDAYHIDNAEKNPVGAFELAMLNAGYINELYYLPTGEDGIGLLAEAYQEAYVESIRRQEASDFDLVFHPNHDTRREKVAERIINDRVVGPLAATMCEAFDGTRERYFFLTLPLQQRTPLDEYPHPSYDAVANSSPWGHEYAAEYTYDRENHAVMLGHYNMPFLCKQLPYGKDAYNLDDEAEPGRMPYTSAIIYNERPLHSIAWLFRNFHWWGCPALFDVLEGNELKTYRRAVGGVCVYASGISTTHSKAPLNLPPDDYINIHLCITKDGTVRVAGAPASPEYYVVNLYNIELPEDDNAVSWYAV